MVVDEAGREVEWRYPRSHGCGPMAGSEHLITFRSACAGFLDLAHDGGTGTLGGFRAGCTANLIVADGVLNAPDYTRTCGCAYQNRSSLGLIHMEEVEYWTYDAGTLWVAVPNVPDEMGRDGSLWWGNPNAADANYRGRTLAEVEPDSARPQYHHSSRIAGGGGLRWVAASGISGVRTVRVPLVGIDTENDLLLRLCFCEMEQTTAGRRVFSVALDGKELIRDLDVVKEAGGPWRILVKEFSGVRYSGRKLGNRPSLDLTFRPKTGEPFLCGVEVLESVPDELLHEAP